MKNTVVAKNLFLPNEPANYYICNFMNVEKHTHVDFYEIFIVLNGEIMHSFNEKQSQMDVNDFCIIRPGDTHSFKGLDKKHTTQHMNIRIQTYLFEQICSEISFSYLNYITGLTNTVKHISDSEFAQINYWINRSLGTVNTTQKLFCLKTVIRLFLSFFYSYSTIVDNTYSDWFNSLLMKINRPDFIDKSAKDIYNEASYSSNYTIKMFKKNLGMTPTEYLTKIKLNYACNLLENSDYTTLYIANLLGFYSLSYFTNIFKKNMNVSPSRYRKQRTNK